MSWKNWNFNKICLLGLKYHYLYSMSRGHPEYYIMEKSCLMNSLARFLLFLVYDNHFWPKNTVRTSFFPKFKKMTMNLNQYYNKQNPPALLHCCTFALLYCCTIPLWYCCTVSPVEHLPFCTAALWHCFCCTVALFHCCTVACALCSVSVLSFLRVIRRGLPFLGRGHRGHWRLCILRWLL